MPLVTGHGVLSLPRTVCSLAIRRQQPAWPLGHVAIPRGDACDVPDGLPTTARRLADAGLLAYAHVGNTEVQCAVSVKGRVLPLLRNCSMGWVTAEYGTTRTRGGQSGRAIHIDDLTRLHSLLHAHSSIPTAWPAFAARDEPGSADVSHYAAASRAADVSRLASNLHFGRRS